MGVFSNKLSKDEIKELEDKASKAVGYELLLDDLRQKTLEAFGEKLRDKIYKKKVEKLWGAREVLDMLIQEYCETKDNLQRVDPKDVNGQHPRLMQAKGREFEALRNDIEETWSSRLKQEQNQLNKKHKVELETSNRWWQSQVEELKAEHRGVIQNKDSEIKNIKRHEQQRWQGVVSDLEDRIETLRIDQRSAEVAHEQRLQDQKDLLETTFADEREELERVIDNLKKKAEDDIEALNAAHTKEFTKLNEEHAAIVQDLRRQKENIEKETRAKWDEDVKVHKQNIASLNEFLFARDRFTPIPDRVLGERFSALVHDVQHLARQPWRPDHAIWSDSAVKIITKNPSRLREQLLQDSIWWILHDYIFCSPFRMFGEEGRLLEKKWNETYGQDSGLRTGEYTWPKPALETEHWRWEAIKESQMALKEAASPLGKRARIKKGFKDSRDGVNQALRTAINEAARVDQGVMSDIEKLVRKAANLWVDFEVQRCRLMMTMPTVKVGTESEKMELAKQKKLVLTSLPGLIRFGDDTGQDLSIRQTVGSHDSDVVRVL